MFEVRNFYFLVMVAVVIMRLRSLLVFKYILALSS